MEEGVGPLSLVASGNVSGGPVMGLMERGPAGSFSALSPR